MGRFSRSLFFAALAASLGALPAGDRPAPLRVLLVTGGCCHDYAAQKEILKRGLEARANVRVDQMFSGDQTTAPALPMHQDEDYARGYDLVIHDECAAGISDPETIARVLKPHREGLPAVVLHCGMHSYRIGDPDEAAVVPGEPHGWWFEFLGLQSSGHGARLPIAVTYLEPRTSITRGLPEWTTIDEELYNNVKIFDSARALARGRQGGDEKVVAWTNRGGKARVFCTTLGHANETVADPRYLDLVARGMLWALGKLDEDGRPVPGYEPAGQPAAWKRDGRAMNPAR